MDQQVSSSEPVIRRRFWATTELLLAFAVAALLAIVLITPPVEAGPKDRKKPKPKPSASRIERIVEQRYERPAVTFEDPAGGFTAVCLLDACFELELDPTVDRFLGVDVRDDLGDAAHVYVFAVAGTELRPIADFCGLRTEAPIALDGAASLEIYLSTTPCDDGTPVLVTSGEVKFTLSNQP